MIDDVSGGNSPRSQPANMQGVKRHKEIWVYAFRHCTAPIVNAPRGKMDLDLDLDLDLGLAPASEDTRSKFLLESCAPPLKEQTVADISYDLTKYTPINDTADQHIKINLPPAKRVKPQRQDSRDSPSRPRSPSPSSTATSESTRPRTFSSIPVRPPDSSSNPSFKVVPPPHSPSYGSLSSEPSVTVIPPSPQSQTSSFQSDRNPGGAASGQVEKERGTRKRPASLFNLDHSPVTTPETDSGMPTPTPTPNKTLGVNGGAHPLTHSSSTSSLRDLVRKAVSRSPSRTRTNHAEPPAPPLPALPIPHRAATVSPEMMHHVADSHAQSSSNSHGPNLTIVPSTESITGTTEFRTSPTSALPTPTQARAYTLAVTAPTPSHESHFLSPDRVRDSDAVSISSTASGRKRRLWRRSSTTGSAQASPKRKTTGLASALVASVAGGPSASPSPSSSSSTTAQPPIAPSRRSTSGSSPPTSPLRRKGSTVKRSPALSGHHAAASQSSVESNALQFSPEAIRSRNNSLSLRPQDHESDYVSSTEGHDDEVEDDSDDDALLAELNDGDIPVTGFAVASNKRNADFHELFRTIPEGDYLIEGASIGDILILTLHDFLIALMLYRLWLRSAARDPRSRPHLHLGESYMLSCKYLGWVTDLIIPIYEIVSLEKKTTAFVIPNAIQITTRTTKYTFASFLARDTAYDVIYNIWRLARPEDGLSDDENMGRSALEATHTLGGPSPNGATEIPAGSAVVPAHKVTHCACGREGKHYSELPMDTDFMRVNQKLEGESKFISFDYRILQSLTVSADIQISDWAPTPGDQKCLARNMSYIKPLNGSIGPRSTKCEIRDETVHSDFDDYVATVTTTRTPDVPSGGVFSVKTRTCITWASSVSSRVVVTSQVEWTGRSFIKGARDPSLPRYATRLSRGGPIGIIEKSAIEGQKTYTGELERAMRIYIQEHQTEFIPAGLDPAAVVVAVHSPSVPTTPTAQSKSETQSEEAARKEREQERNQRGLQWAYDTLEGALSVGQQSATGAIELIRDAWDQSSTSTILYFAIAFLVISNLWTLMLVGKREEVGRRKEMRRTEEREKWVQGIVTALWEELAAGRQPSALAAQGSQSSPSMSILPPGTKLPGPWREEVNEIGRLLDTVEERVRNIRQGLAALD
ncbi:hypothetical protein B0F90DRAFT_1819176 [Multifurca ochricompacta]|uniref:VASt domain-containing protein n=1 Tax=Multifurca ochricompacta TaxID=376703 RepID=A0AAD4M272_9AGAM|nr:hypothetical protein B0F90DRAFT_1819176 [Multifurca ochricompacta]